MVRPLAYFDLVETFPRPGCAVCNLVLRDVDHFLDSLLYERVTERDTHRAFRRGRGLCNEHGWQLARYRGGRLGIAILYKATVDEVLKTIGQASTETAAPSGFARLLNGSKDGGGAALADRLEPTGPCMACKLLAESEQGYIQVFTANVGEANLQAAYRASEGLCLPHFRQALRQVRNPDRLQQIVEVQQDIWTRLKAELDEFIDKNDHLRMHETMGAEGDSWQRAIARMAGEKGVFGVEPRST